MKVEMPKIRVHVWVGLSTKLYLLSTLVGLAQIFDGLVRAITLGMLVIGLSSSLELYMNMLYLQENDECNSKR